MKGASMNDTTMFHAEQRASIAKLVKHIGNDGHTLWKVSVLEGFPPPLQHRFLLNHESDGSPKGSIYGDDGQVIDSLQGVYGLQVLLAICEDLGLNYESKLGRGFQAQACTAAINAWLKCIGSSRS